jgi:citrate lyase beta subunit
MGKAPLPVRAKGGTDGAVEAARSLLYVPGDDRRKLESADRSGADVVVVDFEDGVAEARKREARAQLELFIASRDESGPPLAVRLNAPSSSLMNDDLACVTGMPLVALVVPKAHAAELAALDFGELPILAMIEDARGVRESYEIACDARVVRLALGGVDLAADLGLGSSPGGLELLHVRSGLVVDSAAAGIAPPVDTPFVHYRDDAGLVRECEIVKVLGFSGKACIHPGQVRTVTRAFAPSSTELEWAAAVIEAYDRAVRDDTGVTSYDGEMIDRPVILRARLLLRRARRDNATIGDA